MPGVPPQPFIERFWLDVRYDLNRVNWRNHEADYLFAIIDSVVDAGADEVLSLTTSMHDLVVAPQPMVSSTSDVVVVRAPGSMRMPHPPDGQIPIEFLSGLGKDTEIIRPAAEAVPLFWRFVDTEFGVKPRQ